MLFNDRNNCVLVQDQCGFHGNKYVKREETALLVSLRYACDFLIGYKIVSTDGEVLVFLVVAVDGLKLGIEGGSSLVSSVGSPEVSKFSKFDSNMI